MDLLREYFDCYILSKLYSLIDKENCYSEYYTDSSNFTIVDGEEGNYGILLYYENPGVKLLATTTINGGDSDYTEPIPLGKKIIGEKLKRFLEFTLKKCKDKT